MVAYPTNQNTCLSQQVQVYQGSLGHRRCAKVLAALQTHLGKVDILGNPSLYNV
ncbi:hypothetical protein CDL15_Pgr001814 [Punica granatum]|uniref:Uncharacterized protein n=1 Tax=Punica granatum TaxID=22663 RepID=A0A218XBZ2_PUNGR|nr:hypothetical protein CDL15_Pgr001814 [Punica granatum]